jgi:hypothetical protein
MIDLIVYAAFAFNGAATLCAIMLASRALNRADYWRGRAEQRTPTTRIIPVVPPADVTQPLALERHPLAGLSYRGRGRT